MKFIKFDMPLDGVRVKNMEELREHFTVEVLAHYRSGLLAKWLRSRGHAVELEAIHALSESDNFLLFSSLCRTFGVEVDEDVIRLLFDAAPATEQSGAPRWHKQYEQLAFDIDAAFCAALRRTCLGSPGAGPLRWSGGENFSKGQQVFGGTFMDSYVPGPGRLGPRIVENGEYVNRGDMVGWFDLSIDPEDYEGNCRGYCSLLKERMHALQALAESVEAAALRSALTKRADLLGNALQKLSGLGAADKRSISKVFRDIPEACRRAVLLQV